MLLTGRAKGPDLKMSLHSRGLIPNATLLTGLIQKHHTTQGGRDKGPVPFRCLDSGSLGGAKSPGRGNAGGIIDHYGVHLKE